MSKVAIQGNASGTGTFTVAAPNSNNNQTLTLPDATTTFVGTDATQTLTNKTLTTPTIATIKSAASGTPTVFQDSAGTEVGTLCRAWCNFNGTLAGPITPRASFNVSSVTKNATGDYTLNFTNAMPDTNYGPIGIAGGGSGANLGGGNTLTPSSSSSYRFHTVNSTIGSDVDCSFVSVAIFR